MAKVNKKGDKKGKPGSKAAELKIKPRQTKTVNQDNITHKISDDIFWKVLEECSGQYTKTAVMIQETYAVEYGRSAVQQRAMRQPERLSAIRDKIVDDAEEALHDIINDAGDPFGKPARVKAAMYILNKKGAARGYHEKPAEISATLDQGEGDAKPISLTIKIAQ